VRLLGMVGKTFPGWGVPGWCRSLRVKEVSL
jgi:hypothetical protein